MRTYFYCWAGASAGSQLVQLANLLRTSQLFHRLESHVITSLYMSVYVSAFPETLAPTSSTVITIVDYTSLYKCCSWLCKPTLTSKNDWYNTFVLLVLIAMDGDYNMCNRLYKKIINAHGASS